MATIHHDSDADLAALAGQTVAVVVRDRQRVRVTPERIVLYDGVCGFCNGSVRWLIEREAGARLHYAPLQGETAAALRARHPQIPTEIDTMVFIEAGPGGERVFVRSAAIFRILRELRAPWRWIAPLRHLLPTALWDVAYRAFATRRYDWFGRLEACPVPPVELRARFLD